MANFDELSPEELQILIKDAQATLEQKQSGMRKEVIAQIKALAASIGVTVEIDFSSQQIQKPAQPSSRMDRSWIGSKLVKRTHCSGS